MINTFSVKRAKKAKKCKKSRFFLFFLCIEKKKGVRAVCALATRHYALSVRAPIANQRRGKIESERTTLLLCIEIKKTKNRTRNVEKLVKDEKNDDATQKTREN